MGENMGQKVRVLICDDEPSVADALKLILEDSGYDATVTPDGRRGIKKASEQDFKVIITDLRLSDISGLEVLSWTRQHRPDSTCIVISAHASARLIDECLSLGAFEVLVKPFSPPQILDVVRGAVAREGCFRSRELRTGGKAAQPKLSGFRDCLSV